VLPLAEHPAVYIGDFNSHSTEWDYSSTDDNREPLTTGPNYTICSYCVMLNKVVHLNQENGVRLRPLIYVLSLRTLVKSPKSRPANITRISQEPTPSCPSRY